MKRNSQISPDTLLAQQSVRAGPHRHAPVKDGGDWLALNGNIVQVEPTRGMLCVRPARSRGRMAIRWEAETQFVVWCDLAIPAAFRR